MATPISERREELKQEVPGLRWGVINPATHQPADPITPGDVHYLQGQLQQGLGRQIVIDALMRQRAGTK